MTDRLLVVYARSRSLGGFLIRAASWWDQWSHCGLLTHDGTVLEARAFEGVVETPWGAFEKRYTAFDIVGVEVSDAPAGIAWARSQVGRPYDYGAILEFLLRDPLHDERGWHCVELVESALVAAGRSRFRRPLHKVTVAQSYMVR